MSKNNLYFFFLNLSKDKSTEKYTITLLKKKKKSI